MLLDYIRQIQASQNFKISDDIKFIEFDDLTNEGLEEGEEPDQLEIWAGIQIKFDGDVPESYRTLNYIIGEWVDRHRDELTKVIQEHLVEHAKSFYDDSEVDLEDTMIWEDQLDYMPRIDYENKKIIIDVELVLITEPLEE